VCDAAIDVLEGILDLAIDGLKGVNDIADVADPEIVAWGVAIVALEAGKGIADTCMDAVEGIADVVEDIAKLGLDVLKAEGKVFDIKNL